MVTTATLIDLARRLVLGPAEPIERTREFPDGPAVYVETPERSLSIRSVHDWLRVERAPWVAGLVVITREDIDHGSPLGRVFLLPETGEPEAGEPIDLVDAAHVAALGRRLRDGSLTPEAYAEILVECQWPVEGERRLVTDAAALPAGLPAGAPQPMSTWEDDQGDRWLVFYAVWKRDDVETTLWSVRVPVEGPATWVRRVL